MADPNLTARDALTKARDVFNLYEDTEMAEQMEVALSTLVMGDALEDAFIAGWDAHSAGTDFYKAKAAATLTPTNTGGTHEG